MNQKNPSNDRENTKVFKQVRKDLKIVDQSNLHVTLYM